MIEGGDFAGRTRTFDCTGNVGSDAAALEAAHRGWGVSVVIGVAGGGQGDRRSPPAPARDGSDEGPAFGGFKSRDEVPPLVDQCSTASCPSTPT